MKKETLNYYLYISWNENQEQQIFSSYMMVAKAMIKDKLSEEIQVLNDNVFVFSSNHNFETIKEMTKHRRFPYMLIDITFNMSNGLIATFLQDCEVEILNKFIDNSNKNQIDYFHRKLEECLLEEKYETAAYYRDLIKNNVAVTNDQDIE